MTKTISRIGFVSAASILFIIAWCGKQQPQTSLPPWVSEESLKNAKTISWQNTNPNPINNNDIALWDTSNKYSDFLNKISPKYKEDPQFNTCMVNNIKNCANDIILSKANAANDVKICDELYDKYASDSCKDSITTAQAIKSRDMSLCQKTNLNQWNCFVQVAKTLAVESKDVKYCDEILKYQKPQGSSSSSSEIVALPWMDFKFLKANCVNEVAFQLAQANRDIKYCDFITEKTMKIGCTNSIKTLPNAIPPAIQPGQR